MNECRIEPRIPLTVDTALDATCPRGTGGLAPWLGHKNVAPNDQFRLG